MRLSVRDFVGRAVKILGEQSPVWEFGSYQVQPIGDLRPLFDCKYVGFDMRSGPGVDAFGDAEKMPDGQAGTILCLDTLEHVKRPWLVFEEIKNHLRPGGYAIVSSAMDFRIHEFPNDYWRFTPECFHMLGAEHVWTSGRSDKPHTVIGMVFSDSIRADVLLELNEMAESWSFWWGWDRIGRKVRNVI